MKRKRKRCNRCEIKKPIESFCKNKNKRYKDGLSPTCRNCESIRNQRKAKAVLEYKLLIEAQKGCCAICGKHQSKFKYKLALDHDHNSELIRGLLCVTCNTGLEFYINHQKQIKAYMKTIPVRMIKIYQQLIAKA